MSAVATWCRFLPLLFSLFFTCADARGEASLRVPVFIVTGASAQPVPVHALNQELLTRPATEPVPEWIEGSESEDVLAQVALIDTRITVAAARLGGVYSQAERAFEFAPNDHHAPGYETCFRGEPSQVGDAALALSETLYSEHLGFWGWKYRKQTVVFEMSDATRGYLEKNSPALWKTPPRDDSLLLLTRVTPDGRDIHVTRLKRCE